MLVIGDVAGDDIDAAAMGQLRGLLRGIATSHDTGPADVLTRLDQSMALLNLHTLATATVARLEQTVDERLRGETRLRWADGGHLPPLVITPDGTVTRLTTPRAELMLGVSPASLRTKSVAVLDRGSTVVLYTDGLVERRDSDLDAGVTRLEHALADFAVLPVQTLCDELLERLVDGQPGDDVALVAVRRTSRSATPRRSRTEEAARPNPGRTPHARVRALRWDLAAAA